MCAPDISAVQPSCCFVKGGKKKKRGRAGMEKHVNKATSSGLKKVVVVSASEGFLWELADH